MQSIQKKDWPTLQTYVLANSMRAKAIQVDPWSASVSIENIIYMAWLAGEKDAKCLTRLDSMQE